MALEGRPDFGFPLVLAEAAKGAEADEGTLIRIRTGTSAGYGLERVADPNILIALRLLQAMPTHAGFFLLDAGNCEEWSISEEYVGRDDVLVGASGQLAALLTIAAQEERKLGPRPGALRAGCIWATGQFETRTGTGENRSALIEVDAGGFGIKLATFLDSDDVLFIAPEKCWADLESATSDAPAVKHLRALKGVWRPTDLQAALSGPAFDWESARTHRHKYGVRVGNHEVPALLSALFADAPSKRRTAVDAHSLFKFKLEALAMASVSADRIATLLDIANELNEWEYVIGSLRGVLELRQASNGADMARLALALIDGLKPYLDARSLSMSLLDFACEKDPRSPDLQRAKLELLRLEDAKGPLLDLLLRRGNAPDVDRDERVSLLEEAGRLALEHGQAQVAIGAWTNALNLQPLRTDLIDRLATQAGEVIGTPAFARVVQSIAERRLQASLLIAIASDRCLEQSRRWQALGLRLAAPFVSEHPAVGDVLPLAFELQPDARSLVELLAPVAALRDALLDHYCRPTDMDGDLTLKVRNLRTFIDVTGALDDVMDRLTRLKATDLLLRVAREIVFDVKQAEKRRQRALERALVAGTLDAPVGPNSFREAVLALANGPAPPALANTILTSLRSSNDRRLRYEVLAAMLQHEPRGPRRLTLLTELGEIEEQLERPADAFIRYHEAIQLGAPADELAVPIDRTFESGIARLAAAEERLRTLRSLLQWEPSLLRVRDCYEALAKASQDWEGVVASKRYRLERAVALARVATLWELAVIHRDHRNSPPEALACCDEILKFDAHHAGANRLVKELRPPVRPSPPRPSPVAEKAKPKPAQSTSGAGAERRAVPRAGNADPITQSPLRHATAGDRIERESVPPLNPPPSSSPVAPALPPAAQKPAPRFMASAAARIAEETKVQGQPPQTATRSPKPTSPGDVPGAVTWTETALALLELPRERRDEVLQRTVRRARERDALESLRVAVQSVCRNREPELYLRLLQLMETPTPAPATTSDSIVIDPSIAFATFTVTDTSRSTSPSEPIRPLSGASPSGPIAPPRSEAPGQKRHEAANVPIAHGSHSASSDIWGTRVDALKGLSKTPLQGAALALLHLARREDQLEVFFRALYTRCAETHASLYLDAMASMRSAVDAAKIGASPTPVAPPYVAWLTQRGAAFLQSRGREVTRLVKTGNEARDPRKAGDCFMQAADIALFMREAPRAAALYRRALALHELKGSKGNLPPFQDAAPGALPDPSTWATLVMVSKSRTTTEAASDADRARRIASLLKTEDGDAAAAALILFRVACDSPADEQSLRDLVYELRSPWVRAVLRQEWKGHPAFRAILGRILTALNVAYYRRALADSTAAITLNYSGLILELMDDHEQALSDFGLAMVADPTLTESRTHLREAARRSGALTRAIEYYERSRARHSHSTALRSLLVEQAVLHLAANAHDAARRIVALVQVSESDDAVTRRVVRAVQSSLPLLGPGAWSLLPE